MEQVTVTMYKAKDGSVHQHMSDATARDRTIERSNRVTSVIGALRPELENAFKFGLLNDGGSETRRTTIMTKLAELIEDNFDVIAKARTDANKVAATANGNS